MASVLGVALGVGGLHWLPLVSCAIVAVVAGVWAAPDTFQSRAGSVPVLAVVGLAAYTAFQAVPLPFAWVRVMAPQNAEIWATALAPFGEEAPRWAPLSADPGATLIEALRWLMYAGVLSASILAGARRGLGWAASTLFAFACLVGGITLIHGIFDFHKVYGLYTPTFTPSRWRVGPLLNANNVAGYMNLGVLSGIGVMVSRRPPVSRRLIGFGVAALLPLVVMSGSRAGVASLFCGVFVFGVLFRGAEGKARSWKVIAPAAAAVTGAAILALLGATHETSHELFATNTEKLEMFPYVGKVIWDHPLFGIGRGAFESVFPAYHVAPSNAIFAQAENFPLEWLAGWGVPIGVAALFLFGRLVAGGLRGLSGSRAGAGVFAGLVAVTLQNLLDLAFEVPGVFCTLLLAVGALWGHAHKEQFKPAPEGEPAPEENAPAWVKTFQGFATVATVGLCAVAVVNGPHGVARDRRLLKAQFAAVDYSDKQSVSDLKAALYDAMKRHPADPYFPRVGATVSRRAGDEQPLAWIERALKRGMLIGQTHFELAVTLATHRAFEQALLELRLAAQYEPWRLSWPVARVTTVIARDFDEVTRAIPDGVVGAQIYAYVAGLIPGPAWRTLKLRCLDAAVSRDPDFVAGRSSLASSLVGAMTAGRTESVCAEDNFSVCADFLSAQMSALEKLAPSDSTVPVLKARLLTGLGRAANAEAFLRQECPKYVEAARAKCEREHVDAAVAMHSTELFRLAARDLAAVPCGARGCSANLVYAGASAEAIGDVGVALTYYQRAAEETPTDRILGKVASLASALGEHGLASSAFGRLARSHPEQADVQKSLDEEKLRAMLRAPSE